MSGDWHWQSLDATGTPLHDTPTTRFPTQGDAENHIGQNWAQMLAAGVEAVCLYQDERLVYGPMSLRPAAD